LIGVVKPRGRPRRSGSSKKRREDSVRRKPGRARSATKVGSLLGVVKKKPSKAPTQKEKKADDSTTDDYHLGLMEGSSDDSAETPTPLHLHTPPSNMESDTTSIDSEEGAGGEVEVPQLSEEHSPIGQTRLEGHVSHDAEETTPPPLLDQEHFIQALGKLRIPADHASMLYRILVTRADSHQDLQHYLREYLVAAQRGDLVAEDLSSLVRAEKTGWRLDGFKKADEQHPSRASLSPFTPPHGARVNRSSSRGAFAHDAPAYTATSDHEDPEKNGAVDAEELLTAQDAAAEEVGHTPATSDSEGSIGSTQSESPSEVHSSAPRTPGFSEPSDWTSPVTSDSGEEEGHSDTSLLGKREVSAPPHSPENPSRPGRHPFLRPGGRGVAYMKKRNGRQGTPHTGSQVPVPATTPGIPDTSHLEGLEKL
jgi:hypothetical protein